jgi:hypothetical protein
MSFVNSAFSVSGYRCAKTPNLPLVEVTITQPFRLASETGRPGNAVSKTTTPSAITPTRTSASFVTSEPATTVGPSATSSTFYSSLPPPTTSPNAGAPLNNGAIVGVVIGSLALIAAVGLVYYALRLHHKRKLRQVNLVPAAAAAAAAADAISLSQPHPPTSFAAPPVLPPPIPHKVRFPAAYWQRAHQHLGLR